MRVVEVLCLEKAQRFRCYACRFWHVTACMGTHYSAKNVHCELFFLVFVTIVYIVPSKVGDVNAVVTPVGFIRNNHHTLILFVTIVFCVN